MRLLRGLFVLLAGLVVVSSASAEDATAHRFTATSYAMDYLVSLPAGWTPERTWPVLVAIPDASREFTRTMDAFIAARRSKPWILVVPVVLGGGGTPWRFPESFGYKPDLFARAEKDGLCSFDPNGLASVLQDVRTRFKGEGRAFITGWEAAGHVIWREVIHNPKSYYAAALVLPNFQGRCIDEAKVLKTTAPLPIEILRGGDDKLAFNGAPLDLQTKSAVDYVRGIGHRVDEITVPGKVRGPFPDEVFEFFERVRAGK